MKIYFKPFDWLKLYKGCSESNASHFIMLAQDIRGRYWRYGSEGWTFLPISHYILLLCDRWQQRGSLTQWCLTWKCRWSKGVPLNSSMWKKWHPLPSINTCWMFIAIKQWMYAQWGSEWCTPAVVTVTVGHLCWYRCLWGRDAGLCSSLAKMHR